jgi:hypothetical protein
MASGTHSLVTAVNRANRSRQRPAHKQSWYMANAFGASVTVPAPSSFTRTPMKAASVPHPNGAHPDVRNDPYASDSRIANGILCSAKNRATSLLFVPILSSSAASRLRISTWRANAAPRSLQRYSLIPNKPTPTITTATATRCCFKKLTSPVSRHTRYPRKLPHGRGIQSVNSWLRRLT